MGFSTSADRRMHERFCIKDGTRIRCKSCYAVFKSTFG